MDKKRKALIEELYKNFENQTVNFVQDKAKVIEDLIDTDILSYFTFWHNLEFSILIVTKQFFYRITFDLNSRKKILWVPLDRLKTSSSDNATGVNIVTIEFEGVYTIEFADIDTHKTKEFLSILRNSYINYLYT